jgi:hypothetical protein
MEVSEAIDYIMKAIDCRMRKLIFPTSAWLANYVRPLFPDYIDKKLYIGSKL